jgi:MraZ protein
VTGEYQHSIDSKGRLFIPAKLREELGDVCYVTISMDRCLFIYSEGSWKAFCEKFDALPISKSRKMRVMFANTSKCETDAQGRILIPQKLREYALLKKNVTIIGIFKSCGNLGQRRLRKTRGGGTHAGKYCGRHGRTRLMTKIAGGHNRGRRCRPWIFPIRPYC